MALRKGIRNNKGLNTEYHRISSITLDNDNKKVIVKIKNYADDSYRKKETDFANFNSIINENTEILEDLYKKNIDGEYDEQIKELSKDHNELYLNPPQNMDKETFLSETIEILDLDAKKDYSFKNVYKELKNIDIYIDSEDV